MNELAELIELGMIYIEIDGKIINSIDKKIINLTKGLKVVQA